MVFFSTLGIDKMIISDPHVLESIEKDRSLIVKSKNSFFATRVLNQRVRENVLAMTRSHEQLQRRRAMTHGLTGSQHFKILDGYIQ